MKVVDQFRVRRFPGVNYLGVYHNREVIRYTIKDDEPIECGPVPEFMDIKLTDACNGGCAYCYQNSTSGGVHAENPIERLETYFAGVAREHLPFQVALGGGDPLLHPQFAEICTWFADRGVVPNLTTNGLNFTNENLKVISDLCGGVAITAHQHLDNAWRSGLDRLLPYCESPALHVLMSDADSIDYIRNIIDDYADKVYAIVMLPFVNQGRAREAGVSVDWFEVDRLIANLEPEQLRKLAWGAKAYDYIREQPILKASLSLYEPEQFSRYLDLVTMKEYGSSFDVDELSA